MNKAFQIYLTIIATGIMLFMAAILIACIYIGVQLSQKVAALEKKADGLTSKIDLFNDSVKKLDSSVQNINPFN